MSARHHRNGERGLALVSVLWGMALLSLMALAVLSSSRLSYRMQRNVAEKTTAQTLADSGINRGILSLLDQRPEARWRVDGVAHSFVFADTPISITIQDELGLIDLNAADGELLSGLFQSVGLSKDQSDKLADKVLDWRDTSTAHRLNGAKAPDYLAAGLHYVPRNGLFQSVDELKLVMGMTAEVFHKVGPALTIYSGRPRVDQQMAPKIVLMALPDMTPQKVEDILAARTTAKINMDGQTVPSGMLDPSIPLNGRAFSITAAIDYLGGQLKRKAVIRLTGDPLRPYLVLAWN